MDTKECCRCKRCGGNFSPKNSLHSYCSKKCREQQAYHVAKENNPDGLRRWQKASRDNQCKKTGGYAVYYLPEEHYVGITNNIERRMSNHRLSRRGNPPKITEGYEVLAVFEREIDAHWFEVMLHQRGYLGSRYSC